MRSRITLCIILVLLVAATGCGTGTVVISTTSPATPTVESTSTVLSYQNSDFPASTVTGIDKLCLVLGPTSIERDSFNRTLYEGMQAVATDYNLESEMRASERDPTAFINNVEQCVANGAGIVIGGTYDAAQASTTVAPDHPAVFFVGVEYAFPDSPANYVSIEFRSDEGGFLVGYLAGLVTQSNVVAGIYGPGYLPPLKAFRNGYEQGVALAAQKIGKDITVLGVYMDSFDDPDSGAEQATAFIEQGADVIFGAAGATGSGAILAAAQQGVYVIGVDQNEYFTTFEGGTVAGAEYIISSAMKLVNIGIHETVSALLEERQETLKANRSYFLGSAEGVIEFAGPHDADIPEELYDQVADIQARLIAEELTTGVNPHTGELIAP